MSFTKLFSFILLQNINENFAWRQNFENQINNLAEMSFTNLFSFIILRNMYENLAGRQSFAKKN